MTKAEFDDFFYAAGDGLRLHARVYGRDDADVVVCLPGLTRNARDFHELALYLSSRQKAPRRVIAFDYRGRGQSAWDSDWKNYTILTEAGDILAGLAALNVGHAAFIGTSRGGLILHVLGAMRPAALKAVVLNDIGPVVEGEGLAAIRTYLERAPRPKTVDEAVAVQQAAHGVAFSALVREDWERMVRALFREEGGTLVPDFDPALINSVTSTDLSQPLPTLWPQFEGLGKIPMLVVRGANSRLLSAATAEEMVKRHTDCQLVTVAGQGHAPLLETGGLPGTIAAFLDMKTRAH